MTDIIGKKAQEIREKRISEQESAVIERMDDLQCYSSRIEGCFSEIKEIKLTKRKKNERGKNIQSLSEEVLQNISKIENTLVELKALDSDKASVVEPHYQQKINIWKSQLSEIDILTKKENTSSFFFGTKKKEIPKVIQMPGENIDISLQNNDIEELKSKLIELGSIIDSNIKWFCSGNKKIKSALYKFESGLIMLKSKNPQEPIIPHFETKQDEWNTKVKRAKLSKIAIIVVIIAWLLLPELI